MMYMPPHKRIAVVLAFIALTVLIGMAVPAFAVQITVPSAAGVNRMLVSSSTGQYIATTTLNAGFITGGLSNAQLQNSSFSTSYTGTTLSGASVVNLGGTLNIAINLANPNTWTGTQDFAKITATNATSGTLTSTGLGLFGDVGGIYNYSVGSGVGTIGWNSNGYVAGVAGFGALMQLVPTTGVFTMFLESNVAAGSAHAHTTTLQWDGTGIVYIPQGFVAQSSSTVVGLFTTSQVAAYSTTASSTFKGITATNINLTGSATSTAANGIDITSGCFSISGSCLQQIISSASAYKQAVRYASTSTLPANTYSNGVAGVGATLTAVANGPFYIDGNTPTVGDRVLVKNESAGANNGIYTVTTLGVAGLSAYVLTRATDYNNSADVFPGVANFVNGGTQNANTCWILTNTTAITIGTTALTYADECGAGSFTATYPILLSGTVISTAFGTSTRWVTGEVAFVNSNGNVSSTATTTLTGGGPITVSNSPVVLGGSGAVLGCATCYTGNGFDFSTANYAGTAVVSTSTGLWDKATIGFGLVASSTFFTQASTTQLTNTGSEWNTSLTNGLLWDDVSGKRGIQASSTLYGSGSPGQVLSWSGNTGAPVWIASSSAATSLTGGTAGMLTSWLTTTTVTATSSPTAAYYVATSTIASLFPYASSTMNTFTNTASGAIATGLVMQNLGGATSTASQVLFLTLASSSAVTSTTTASITSVLMQQNNFNNTPDKGDLVFSTLQSGLLNEAGRFASTGFFGVATSVPSSAFSVGNVLNFSSGTSSIYGTGFRINSGCYSIGANCLSFGNIAGQANLTTQVTGTLPVGNGGTASTTLGGILIGNGASAVNSLIFGPTFSLSGNTLKNTHSLCGFDYPATSTTGWQAGTTTVHCPIVDTGTLTAYSCKVFSGAGTAFLNVQVGTGLSTSTMMQASSTYNTNATSLSLTAGGTLYVLFGTTTVPVNIPDLMCTGQEQV